MTDGIHRHKRYLTPAQLESTTVRVEVPGRKKAINFPVTVRHSMSEGSRGLSALFNPDEPRAPVHTFTLTLSEEAVLGVDDESPARAKSLQIAFDTVRAMPGAVVTIDPESRSNQSRMVEIARIAIRAHSTQRCLETGGCWFEYLDAFDDWSSEVGLAIESLLRDKSIKHLGGIDTPRTVYYIVDLNVHPCFRGNLLGARLTVHAIRGLVGSPLDLFFAHAAPACDLYSALPESESQAMEEPVDQAKADRLVAYFSRIFFERFPWSVLNGDPLAMLFGGTGADQYGPLIWTAGQPFYDDDEGMAFEREEDIANEREDELEFASIDDEATIDPGSKSTTLEILAGAFPEMEQRLVEGNMRRLRSRFISPLHVGAGPFPAVAPLEKWIEVVEICVHDIGIPATLDLMREGLLHTVPGRVAFVSASDWVAASVTAIERTGLQPFLRALVTRLRVVLDDLPPGLRIPL